MWDLLSTNCPRTATIHNILWSDFLRLPPGKTETSLPGQTVSFIFLMPPPTQHTFMNHLRPCQETLARRRAQTGRLRTCLCRSDFPTPYRTVPTDGCQHPNWGVTAPGTLWTLECFIQTLHRSRPLYSHSLQDLMTVGEQSKLVNATGSEPGYLTRHPAGNSSAKRLQ